MDIDADDKEEQCMEWIRTHFSRRRSKQQAEKQKSDKEKAEALEAEAAKQEEAQKAQQAAAALRQRQEAFAQEVESKGAQACQWTGTMEELAKAGISDFAGAKQLIDAAKAGSKEHPNQAAKKPRTRATSDDAGRQRSRSPRGDEAGADGKDEVAAEGPKLG